MANLIYTQIMKSQPRRLQDKEILFELKALREEALAIYEAKSLYDIWEFIPVNEVADTKDAIFSEYLKQGWEPRVYTKWTEAVEELFANNSLNLLRFKQVTETLDPTKESDSPASMFIRKYKEVDNLVTKKVNLEDYKIDLNLPTKWPKVSFEDGVVWQGRVNHPFQEERYIKIIELLWDKRRILDPLGNILIDSKPTSRDDIFKQKIKQIVDNGSLGVVRNGIKKAMNSKKINLRLINQNSKNVYLEVIQK